MKLFFYSRNFVKEVPFYYLESVPFFLLFRIDTFKLIHSEKVEIFRMPLFFSFRIERMFLIRCKFSLLSECYHQIKLKSSSIQGCNQIVVLSYFLMVSNIDFMVEQIQVPNP